MPAQLIPLRNKDLPRTIPAFTPEDNRAFGLGALIGLCFSLAVISAVIVALVALAPTAPRLDRQAWTPTVTAAPANQ
jgi:hypothetical protein